MIPTTLAVTVSAPALSSGIATQQALLDVGRTLAPFGWGICAYVAVVLVALLAAIAVEAFRTRDTVATRPLAAGAPPSPWTAPARSPS
jgi:hypothetical protein